MRYVRVGLDKYTNNCTNILSILTHVLTIFIAFPLMASTFFSSSILIFGLALADSDFIAAATLALAFVALGNTTVPFAFLVATMRQYLKRRKKEDNVVGRMYQEHLKIRILSVWLETLFDLSLYEYTAQCTYETYFTAI